MILNAEWVGFVGCPVYLPQQHQKHVHPDRSSQNTAQCTSCSKKYLHKAVTRAVYLTTFGKIWDFWLPRWRRGWGMRARARTKGKGRVNAKSWWPEMSQTQQIKKMQAQRAGSLQTQTPTHTLSGSGEHREELLLYGCMHCFLGNSFSLCLLKMPIAAQTA